MSFSFNAKTFSFQTKFNMNDVQYDIKVSSNKVEEQGRIMGQQVITLMKNTEGVNLVRKEMMMKDPEFLLTGEGLMENASEEDLKNFAIERMMLIQEAELKDSMVRFLGHSSEEFSEMLDHFFPDIQKKFK